MRGIYQDAKRSKHKERRGFTIVELLIVVVVIAILAAITVVAYNGITANAKEVTLKSNLKTAAAQLNVERIRSDSGFPLTKPDYIQSDLSYISDSSIFCVFGSANNKVFHADDVGNVKQGGCPPPTTMQAMTPAYCSTLETYNGSNPGVILSLTDSRGGTTRTYEVAKLADGKCWMLTNLKLGSTSDPIVLTPNDSDVVSNRTLPQLSVSGITQYSIPLAYGPIPGDTGAGSTNYGYLYNWSAATAGATIATNPGGSGTATNSICPAGWKLPSGGATGDLAWLNAKMNNPVATSPATSAYEGFYQNWQYTGPFRGVYSGTRDGDGFKNQGSNGVVWSATVSTTGDTYANVAGFGGTSVGLGGQYRFLGSAVRCILK